MKKKMIIYILIIAIIFIGVFVFSNKSKQKLMVVKTTTAATGEINAYLSTTATIKSKDSKQYYGIQARIKKVNVSVGDKVKKGDVLVVYETADLVTGVKQAQIQYDNAVLQKNDLLNQNKTLNSRIADLNSQINVLSKSANPADKVKVETLKEQKSSMVPFSTEKLKLAKNAVDLAKLSLDSSKQRLTDNKGTIVAQNNGVVTVVNAIEGTASNGMQPVIEVQDIENLKAVASLGKYDANRIALGQDVIIKSGDKVYSGKVSLIGPVATKTLAPSGGDSTLSVEINILNKAPQLKIDFDCDVDILTGQVKNVVKIPAECLKTEKNNRNLAYVLEGNIVHERVVNVGLRSDTEVEIKSGINAGENIILNPSTSISEGVLAKGE